jgi:hypothetical protein
VRQIVVGFLDQRPGFASRAVHVGFVVYKVVLGQLFLQVILFSLSVSLHSSSIFTRVSSAGLQNGRISCS